MDTVEMKDKDHGSPRPMLSPEQWEAIEKIHTGGNCFITGRAGSGKSHMLLHFLNSTSEPMLVLAPTGSVSVAVGGMTIHKCFSLPPHLLTPDYDVELRDGMDELLRYVDKVVIEEISMVRSDLFCTLERILRENAESPDNFEPFGNKKIIICGDPYQLPPVAQSHKNERRYLKQYYGSVFPYFTEAWKSADFLPMVLRSSHRQRDPEFIDILDTISVSGQHFKSPFLNEALQKLNSSVRISKEPPEEATVLCNRNEMARRINELKDAELGGEPYVFEGDYKNFDFRSMTVPLRLQIRIGSYVLIMANKPSKHGGYAYVNGDTGYVTDIDQEKRAVKVRLTGSERTVRVTAYKWNEYTPYLSDDAGLPRPMLLHKVCGWYKQIPLKLGYAVSCHKSLGTTIKGPVHIELGRGPFTSGQLYVALSRVRSMQELSLSRQITADDVLLEPDIAEFMQGIYEHSGILTTADNQSVF